METIHDLRAELNAAGLGRPATGRMFAKMAILVGIAIPLLVASVAVEPWWAKLLLLIAGSWFNLSATLCGHDGAHQAVSGRRWVNDLVALLGFTFLGGLGADYWRNKHNKKHHPFCNSSSQDPDVVQWPFALSMEQHKKAGWFFRGFHRIQAWAFYPICFVFIAPLMRWASFVYALKHARQRSQAALDLLFIGLHHALWLGVPPLLGATLGQTLFLFLGTTAFGSLYLAFIFSPAHMTTSLVKAWKDPLLLQLATTRNMETIWLFRQTLIGLDQQIEHHLVPKLSHFDLPKARPIVKAFCERNGLPYHVTSWSRGLLDLHVHIDSAWDLPEIVVGDALEPMIASMEAREPVAV